MHSTALNMPRGLVGAPGSVAPRPALARAPGRLSQGSRAFDLPAGLASIVARVAQQLAPMSEPVDAPAVTPASTMSVAERSVTESGTTDRIPHPDAKTGASPEILSTWANADAVCFDVDCTVTINDGLDVLAEFMGVAQEVAELTSRAMDGSMSLEFSLEERLRHINCKPDDVRLFNRAYPPTSRLAPGVENLIKALQARGKAIYLISGGFRELIVPIADYLGIPRENIIANRMRWQWDDETGMPSQLAGFDPSQPTSRNLGKIDAIAMIRANNPYNTVVMIGDGITDLEAVQSTRGADLFIGYGGVVEREAVCKGAEWYVYDYSTLVKSLKRNKVAMIGSGAWACASVRMMAQNTRDNDPAQEFVDEITMWVHEEDFEGMKLTEHINKNHTNEKYFPGVELGPNVFAEPDIVKAVANADMIVFCTPHQFLGKICKQLSGKVKPGAIAISLIKGMEVKKSGPQLISQQVRKALGIDCCVMMGANIAGDIAREEYSEAVIGYQAVENGEAFKKLLQRPYFNINLLPDSVGTEMCGTLKNIVALGAGMVDGMGMGPNSKAIVIKQGLSEMKAFSKALYPQVRDETFLESCGVADLIATCYGGRNRLVAEEWTKRTVAGEPATFDDLEKSMLKGQKLQGLLTSNEVQEILKLRGWESNYPLFTTINLIVNGHCPPRAIIRGLEGQTITREQLIDEFDMPTPNATATAIAAVTAASRKGAAMPAKIWAESKF